ncbi:MAG: hypothetical protein AB7O04_05380 [Hyphomonadaceae bacterium]
MAVSSSHVTRTFRIRESELSARFLRLKIELDKPRPQGESATDTPVVLQEPWLGTNNWEMFTSQRAVRLGPYRFCIYCGRTKYRENENRPLGVEHVIMAGIGGSLELLEASCWECEKATSGIETKVVADMFDVPRRFLKVKMRAKTKNPRLPFKVIKDGADVDLRIPFDRHPRILLLPEYSDPGIVSGQEPQRCNVSSLWVEELSPAQPAAAHFRSFYTPKVDMVLYAQFLAKIAHAFAISQYAGDARYRPFLSKVIRTGFGDTGVWKDRHYFVGGKRGRFAPSSALHELGLLVAPLGGKNIVVVRIRLFAMLGAPIYLVAVGALVGELSPGEMIAQSS